MTRYEKCIKLAKRKYNKDYITLDRAVYEAVEFYYSFNDLFDLYRLFDMTQDQFIEHLKRRVCEKD